MITSRETFFVLMTYPFIVDYFTKHDFLYRFQNSGPVQFSQVYSSLFPVVALKGGKFERARHLELVLHSKNLSVMLPLIFFIAF